jgi:hypothetical protein
MTVVAPPVIVPPEPSVPPFPDAPPKPPPVAPPCPASCLFTEEPSIDVFSVSEQPNRDMATDAMNGTQMDDRKFIMGRLLQTLTSRD